MVVTECHRWRSARQGVSTPPEAASGEDALLKPPSQAARATPMLPGSAHSQGKSKHQEPFFTHSSAQWAQLDDVDVADELSLSHPVPAIHALRGTLVGAFGGLHEANGPAASAKPIQASRAWMLFVLEHAARTLAGA